MNVRDHVSVGMWAPRARFNYQETPFYVHTDFPWEAGIANQAEAKKIVFDVDRQCVHPQPIFVPHHQGLFGNYPGGAPTFPKQNWIVEGAGSPTNSLMNRVYGVNELQFTQASPSTLDVWAHTETLAAQGFTFLFSRKDTPLNAPQIQAWRYNRFEVGIGDGVDRVMYAAELSGQGFIKIEKGLPDGSGGYIWTEIGGAAGGGQTYRLKYGSTDAGILPAPEELLKVEFILLAGTLSITIGNDDQPYLFEEARIDSSGNPIWQIKYARFMINRPLGLRLLGCPMKWHKSCQWESPDIPIGFRNTDWEDPAAETAGQIPPGWDATYLPLQSNLDGPIVNYAMKLEGPTAGTFVTYPWSNYCACVRAVNLVWIGKQFQSSVIPSIVDPERVIVSHTFDPNTLQIVSGAQLFFQNNQAVLLPSLEYGTWGQFMMNRGQVAVEILSQRTTAAGGMSAFERTFCGYGATKGKGRSSQGSSGVILFCEDRRRQLESPRWNLPWMDGWNFFYALAYLAQLGKVTLGDLKFGHLVPMMPFGPGSDLGDGEGGPAPYLPVGSVGSVITRPSGIALWAQMSKIAMFFGFMLFFDVDGQLQARKFRLPFGIKRHFFESDHESTAQIGGGLEGCWDIETDKDMDQVRSDAIVIGVNSFSPQWDPIVYKYSDSDVENNALAFNHLGYPNPAVWMDAIFAEEAFADEACQEMIRWVRLPGFDVRVRSWIQPDIFPLDVINVFSNKLGTSWIRLMVVQVIHDQSKDAPQSIITARFVPE